MSRSDPEDRGCFSDIRLMVQGFEGNKDTNPRWFINPFESLLNPPFPLTVPVPPSMCTEILGGKPTARSLEQLELRITRSRENIRLTLEIAYDVSTAMNKVASWCEQQFNSRLFAAFLPWASTSGTEKLWIAQNWMRLLFNCLLF